MAKYDIGTNYGTTHGSGIYHSSTYLQIEPKDVILLKNLKSEKLESAYIDSILSWKEKDNEMSTKDIATLVHFMARLAPFNPEFLKKYNVKQYHIGLIRRLYIEHEDYEGNKALMGYKRPYGNSNVLGDVYEEYMKIVGPVMTFEKLPKSFIKEQEEFYDDGITEDVQEDLVDEYISEHWAVENEGLLLNIHNETMDILEHMLTDLELPSMEWTSDNGNNFSSFNNVWTPTEIGLQQYQSLKRERKLERILG